jgi:hypothetical protein
MKDMAERVGFEPTLEFPLNTLSKRAPSATRPSLRTHTIQAGSCTSILGIIGGDGKQRERGYCFCGSGTSGGAGSALPLVD